MPCRWIVVALAALLLVAAGCGDPSTDNGALSSAYHANQPAEVTVTAKVTRLLPDSSGSDGTHERFAVDAGLGTDVEIDHNVSLAARVPAAIGDALVIHGQFEPDPGRPVIHYTHHATGHHEGGWIQLNGQTYQ